MRSEKDTSLASTAREAIVSSLIFLRHKEWSSPEGRRREEERDPEKWRERGKEGGRGGGGRDTE